jgi:hypothetical protein
MGLLHENKYSLKEIEAMTKEAINSLSNDEILGAIMASMGEPCQPSEFCKGKGWVNP